MKKLKIIQLENEQLSQKAMTGVAGGLLDTCRCTLYEWGCDTAANTQTNPPPGGNGGGGSTRPPEGPTCICFTFGTPGSYGDSANDNLNF